VRKSRENPFSTRKKTVAQGGDFKGVWAENPLIMYYRFLLKNYSGEECIHLRREVLVVTVNLVKEALTIERRVRS